MKQLTKQAIVKRSDDFDRWYTDVILKAELADYAPVKGCMIIRPYGYAIWEHIEEYLDKKFKSIGVENAYFPMFIPMEFLKREKEHVEGFSPELAVVTHGGGEKLAEPLAVRPTSETIMYDSYSRWIQSWRDLPLLLNVWNSVVRWEKRTYLFLRTAEFLWQEGHTAHATYEEADAFARKILTIYQWFDEEILALPVLVGKKSKSEKFAGAATTYTLEALMPDGKALQAGTSHNLGDNFARAFSIMYLDKDGERKYVWQTSWAETTRIIGAIIMAHGDDQGLVLPPRIAPKQVMIVPIGDDANVQEASISMKTLLDGLGIRAYIDRREEKSMGWKFHEWELKGVPVRLEVGKKEVAAGMVGVYRRDTQEKVLVPIASSEIYIQKLLDDIQTTMLQNRKEFVRENTHEVDSYDEFKKIMKTSKGFLRAFWCEDAVCEKRIKEETKATTRCLPLDAKEEKGSCIYCKKSATHRWYFAQSY